MDVPSLNPRRGEQAVTVKGRGGDWGVLVGRWIPLAAGGSLSCHTISIFQCTLANNESIIS